MQLDEPLRDHAYSLPSPFISCPYHVLKIRVEGCQSPQPTHHEPIRARTHRELDTSENLLYSLFIKIIGWTAYIISHAEAHVKERAINGISAVQTYC